MGLFDKLRRGDDSEEVELKPAQHTGFDRARRQVNDPRTSTQGDQHQGDEVELEDMWEMNRRRAGSDRSRSSGTNRRDTSRDTGSDDDDSDDFILPGMKTVADEEEEQDEPEPSVGPSGDKLDRLLEQNERIITLLEDIADMTDDDTDTTETAPGTDMW